MHYYFDACRQLCPIHVFALRVITNICNITHSDHYHWRKGYPYEFSSHVPFIVSWPSEILYINEENAAVVAQQQNRGQIRTEIVELRDLFPTFLDIGNGNNLIPNDINGSSILKLILAKVHSKDNTVIDTHQSKAVNDDSGDTWRSWIDLEHNICYNITNHWNALTDGKIKYIYRAYFGDEQLFNLTNDPYEMNDLSRSVQYSSILTLWRARLVQQFVNEQRGVSWVKHGKLVRRIQGTLYSPHYPN